MRSKDNVRLSFEIIDSNPQFERWVLPFIQNMKRIGVEASFRVVDTAQYQIEVYRNFQPEKHDGEIYRAFIFNANGSRPLGKVVVVNTDSAMVISGYRVAEDYLTEETFSYETFKYCALFSLFLPETPDNESIIEE